MALGGPVKLTWLREGDFAHDNYRPMAAIAAKATLDGARNISAWPYRIATPSISWQRATATNGAKSKLDAQAVEGAIGLPYARGAVATQWVPLDGDVAGIPVGYWRSVVSARNVHAPVGLAIGGNQPETIALAIAAEVQAALSGAPGGYLRARPGSIHAPALEVGATASPRPCACEPIGSIACAVGFDG